MVSQPVAEATPIARRTGRTRIGFLFNHDQVHQVAHSLPVALALARAGTGAEIVIATTNDRLRAEVVRLGGGVAGSGVSLVPLSLARTSSRVLERALGGVIPASKLLVYRDNLDFFQSLDVLVVAEKTSLILKTRYGLDGLKMIHTRHGAGDRAIGFDAASARFDHVLVSGPKIRDRLVRETGLDAARITIVGYPKFDLFAETRTCHAMVDQTRPVVLYNPHCSPHLSSWYEMGRQVLDWFVAHDEYQLVFAPHVMLFERPFVTTIDRMRIDRPGRIDERYLRAPNIHFDLGSRLSTTMAYTNGADIYLGDVSSQVYEFLIRPRPCLFLDAHRTQWQGDANYAHWRAGRVLASPDALGDALAEAQADHDARYRQVQEQLVRDSFDLTDEPSSLRAARAVATVAGLPWPRPVETCPARAYG
jgi:hypothetical protein